MQKSTVNFLEASAEIDSGDLILLKQEEVAFEPTTPGPSGRVYANILCCTTETSADIFFVELDEAGECDRYVLLSGLHYDPAEYQEALEYAGLRAIGVEKGKLTREDCLSDVVKAAITIILKDGE